MTDNDNSPFSREEILDALESAEDFSHMSLRFKTLLSRSAPTHRFTESEIVEATTTDQGILNDPVPLLWALQLRRNTRNPDHHCLTARDLDNHPSEAWPPALIQAAGNSVVPRLLSALPSLDTNWDPSQWWQFTTPLRTAIRTRLVVNVRALLDAGADPNGVSRCKLTSYAARFLRFRPQLDSETCPIERGYYLDEIERAGFPSLQDAPLTEGEIDERRRYRAVFWAEVSIPPDGSFYMSPEPLALEVAAKTGDCTLVDILLDVAKPDIQAWVQRYEKMPEEREPSLSYLSPTTPLHVAIVNGDIPMVKHLLGRGFSANVFPLVAITCCLNPIMATIVLAPERMRMTAYETVSPYADLTLYSKVFHVHILHHAVATLDLALIQRIEADVPLSSAGGPTTALGHKLLHIACLPRDQKHLNSISTEINQSVHDLRTMLPAPYPCHPHPLLFKPRSTKPPRPQWVRSTTPPLSQLEQLSQQQEFLASLTSEFAAQTAVISYLLSSTSSSSSTCHLEMISAHDIHGNTALHYLASYVMPNDDAITLLKEATRKQKSDPDTDNNTDAETATVTSTDDDNSNKNTNNWPTLLNHWNFTAQNLYASGQLALEGWKARGGTSTWTGQMQWPAPAKEQSSTMSQSSRQEGAHVTENIRKRDEEAGLSPTVIEENVQKWKRDQELSLGVGLPPSVEEREQIEARDAESRRDRKKFMEAELALPPPPWKAERKRKMMEHRERDEKVKSELPPPWRRRVEDADANNSIEIEGKE